MLVGKHDLVVIYFLLLLIFFCSCTFLAGIYGNIWCRFFNSIIIMIYCHHYYHKLHHCYDDLFNARSGEMENKEGLPIYKESDDQWEAYRISLLPITDVYGSGVNSYGLRLSDILVSLAYHQAELLIFGIYMYIFIYMHVYSVCIYICYI
jgi:hypothetical protein